MIDKKVCRIIFFLGLWLPVLNLAFARGDSIEQLRTFLKSSQSMSANFKQTMIDENGNPSRTNYGEFFLQRPGKFRWNYLKPFKQEIVSDSGKVWYYDEDLEQVTIRKLDKSVGATPALLLSGDINLEDNFSFQQQGSDGEMSWIKLLPKNEDSGFKYVLIGFDQGLLAGMELSDNFGQLTRIYFSEIKMNPKLPDSLFKFTPPEGVDVFEEGL